MYDGHHYTYYMYVLHLSYCFLVEVVVCLRVCLRVCVCVVCVCAHVFLWVDGG